MKLLRPVCGLFRGALAAMALCLAATALAADAGFSAGLSAQERSLAGLDRLKPAQVAALDALVEHDVLLARQGGVTGFASDFTARHPAGEAAAAGFALLSPQETAFLNALVSRSMAVVPLPGAGFTYEPHAAAPAPAPAPTLVSAPAKAELHGDVSVTVGGGSHGSYFYGSSVDAFVTDPSGKWTLGVGVGEYKSKGPIGPFGPYWIDPALSPLP